MKIQEFENILINNNLQFIKENINGHLSYIIATKNKIAEICIFLSSDQEIIYGLRDIVSKKFIFLSQKIITNQRHIDYIIQSNIKELINVKLKSCPKCKSILLQYHPKDQSYNFFACLNCNYLSALSDTSKEVCRENTNSKMSLAKRILSHSQLRYNKFAQSLLSQLNAKGKLSDSQLAYVIGRINPKGFGTFQKQINMFGFVPTKEKVSNEELQYIIDKRRKEINRSYKIQTAIKESKAAKIISTDKYKYVKYSFKKFNPIQSIIYDHYKDKKNIVLASPTSSGKTICAEMIMGYILSKGKKVIYMSPLKALSNEKYNSWTNEKHTFSKYNVAILTGDFHNTKAEDLQKADIICMTSEMLDSKTRKIESDKNKWMKSVRAVIVDEAHLITSGYENEEDNASNVNTRGDRLEAGLMRFSKNNKKAKIMLLSATMPNVKELCRWLTILNKKDTELIYSTWRPTKLDIHYVPYQTSTFQRSKENKFSQTLQLIMNYVNDKFLIFVHSKSEGRYVKKQLLDNGIACDFHNANLTLKERNNIENLFKQSDLRVLIATSTIAYGCFANHTNISMWNGTFKKIKNIIKNDEITTISKNGNIEKGIVKNIITKIIDKKINININIGNELSCSLDHPFYVINNNNLILKKAKNLKINDLIPIPTKYNFINHSMELHKIYLSELLGLIFGDGYLSFNKHSKCLITGLTFSPNDISMDIRIRKLIKKITGYDAPKSRKNKDGVMQFATGAQCVTKLIKPHMKSQRKIELHIPKFCFENNKYLSLFLQALFDTDGCIWKQDNNNYKIELTSISLDLLKEVQFALLRFNIISTLHKQKGRKVKFKNLIIQNKQSFRIKIYGKNVRLFHQHIGFKLKRKQNILQECINKSDIHLGKGGIDVIPIGKRLKYYQKEKNIPASVYRNIFFFTKNIYNFKRHPMRITINKLKTYGFSKYSLINFLFSDNIAWCKIKNIKIKKTKEKVYDLNINNNSNYIANNVLVHNCNLPARRVIIFGWHRGMKQVSELDIIQETGRAGRLGLDDKGDAYILTPSREINAYKAKIENMRDIESCLNNKYNLAFHITAEIAGGEITDLDSCKQWFSRSLAYLQNKKLDSQLLENIINTLISMKIIKEKNGKFVINQLGLISSWMYFNPYDIYAWYSNFNEIFKRKLFDDASISWALTHNTSYGLPYVPNEIAVEVCRYTNKIKELDLQESQGDIYGAIIYILLRGTQEKNSEMLARQIKYDCDRIFQTLQLMKSKCTKHWNNNKLKVWNLRIKYGIQDYLVELVKIKGIGRVKAQKLYALGIKNQQDYKIYMKKRKNNS